MRWQTREQFCKLLWVTNSDGFYCSRCSCWILDDFYLPLHVRDSHFFIYQSVVALPKGVVITFCCLFNLVFFWCTWLFPPEGPTHNTRPLSLFAWMEYMHVIALSFHSGCDTQGLYGLNLIVLCTLNTLRNGQTFPLTAALRVIRTTIILGSRASW